jgi:hypothetical protein
VDKKTKDRREAVRQDAERERQLLARAVLNIERKAVEASRTTFEPPNDQDDFSIFSDRSSVQASGNHPRKATVSTESSSPTKHLLHMSPKKRTSTEASLWQRAAAIASGDDPEELQSSGSNKPTERARHRETALWEKAHIIARNAQ